MRLLLLHYISILISLQLNLLYLDDYNLNCNKKRVSSIPAYVVTSSNDFAVWIKMIERYTI